MLRSGDSFTSVVRAALASTPVAERLRYGEAIVLERVAYGGGATNWFYCRSREVLPAIEEILLPGSVVSFYFDKRIAHSPQSSELLKKIESMLTPEGDPTVGVLGDDGIRIHATPLFGRNDFAEFLSEIDPSAEIFYGAFPGRDNDGTNAVTVTMPDEDGVVRGHPH